MHINDLIALVVRDYQLHGRRSLTKMLYHARHLAEYFSDVPRTTLEIVEYTMHRRKVGLAPQTINNELSVLSKGLRLALQFGLLDSAPEVPRLSVQNRRTGFIDPPDFWRAHMVLKALDEDAADICAFLYLCGWRSSEATRLEWSEVDPDLRAASLPTTKTGYPRRVRFGRTIVEIFERRRAVTVDCPYVFHRSGKPMRTWYTSWYRALEAANVRRHMIHSMRRSFARNALLAGVPVPVIMQIAGWTTISTFLRYAIVDENAHEDAFAQMAAIELWRATGDPACPPEETRDAG